MLEDILKIIFAILAGGLIGMERENVHRPAGFRTHILVCVGSTLVMMTSEYIFNVYYKGHGNIDVARLGAQVISGIGFLGAGTIIKDGATVKGLTTAATLWAVACIGLAIGIGYYKGAVVATAAVYLTLIFLKKFEVRFVSKGILRSIVVEGHNLKDSIQKIDSILSAHSITIKDLKFIHEDTEKVYYKVLVLPDVNINQLITDLYLVEGVRRIFFE
ncbi:MgtC/SapB family protein [Caldicellulosiruptor naganoensis]|uniref:MgtC/SapB family protein n=1 Tax=Caldicellulosiruptor naganoensis TaxID=29324 RepID=A0ABY7BHK3_9FIRM|nr:MgtC/SapB family protein [Caldicellulosiruptor naganoensis]WAM31071.1 MgtC/SapB family protein [Caldicellulosiruptor naganoensis]